MTGEPILRLAALTVLALTGVVMLVGCGGSSKPAYCSDVNDFKNAVGQLKDVGSPSAIVSSVGNVVSTGQTAVSAVKAAFAPETAAVKSSLTALDNSVKQLSSSSTRASALTQIPAEVTAVKTAADNFVKAATTKC